MAASDAVFRRLLNGTVGHARVPVNATVPYTRIESSREGGHQSPSVKEPGRTRRNAVAIREAARRSPDLDRCRACSDFWSSSASSAGSAYVAVFALANFVKYKPREIIVTVPPDKFLKQQR